jgi:hypothetical protein
MSGNSKHKKSTTSSNEDDLYATIEALQKSQADLSLQFAQLLQQQQQQQLIQLQQQQLLQPQPPNDAALPANVGAMSMQDFRASLVVATGTAVTAAMAASTNTYTQENKYNAARDAVLQTLPGKRLQLLPDSNPLAVMDVINSIERNVFQQILDNTQIKRLIVSVCDKDTAQVVNGIDVELFTADATGTEANSTHRSRSAVSSS